MLFDFTVRSWTRPVTDKSYKATIKNSTNETVEEIGVYVVVLGPHHFGVYIEVAGMKYAQSDRKTLQDAKCCAAYIVESCISQTVFDALLAAQKGN